MGHSLLMPSKNRQSISLILTGVLVALASGTIPNTNDGLEVESTECELGDTRPGTPGWSSLIQKFSKSIVATSDWECELGDTRPGTPGWSSLIQKFSQSIVGECEVGETRIGIPDTPSLLQKSSKGIVATSDWVVNKHPAQTLQARLLDWGQRNSLLSASESQRELPKTRSPAATIGTPASASQLDLGSHKTYEQATKKTHPQMHTAQPSVPESQTSSTEVATKQTIANVIVVASIAVLVSLFLWEKWLRPMLKAELSHSKDFDVLAKQSFGDCFGPPSQTGVSKLKRASVDGASCTNAQLPDAQPSPDIAAATPLPRGVPEEDAASVESIPELLPSRATRHCYTRWKSTGLEIPWQCQARKYYVWLLPIFAATLVFATIPFFLFIFYLPGWEVLLKIVEGFPLAFGIPIFFAALASPVATYAWHFLRLRGTDGLPSEPSTAIPMTHAVVVVAYKEPLDVLHRTMDSIVAQRGLWKQPIVVFATEERDETAQSTFTELAKRVENHFAMFLLTKHPLVEGETVGKSSNENYAVQELYKRLVEEEKRDPFEVLVTIVDADSIVSSTYLAHLETSVRAQRDGRRLLYSGPLSVHRNFADAGLVTQCYDLSRCHGDTFHDPFSMYQPQSNYSLTLGFAQELGFWTPDLMPEDIHTANKARVNNFGSRTTVAIPSIICNDLVVQLPDRYTQAKRHQMGSITEFAWALSLFFETRTSFPGWWAVFKVEMDREGSFLDIARSIMGYGCQATVTYLILAHWSLLHWKCRLYLSFGICLMAWRWLWFWIAELFLWQGLLQQFPVKRPSVARWVLIVSIMPVLLFMGEMIFYLGATLQCLWQITFVGELAYVCAPKGDDLAKGDDLSASGIDSPTKKDSAGSTGAGACHDSVHKACAS